MYKKFALLLISIAAYSGVIGQNINMPPASVIPMITLNCGNMAIDIDANTGARVNSFKLEGDEILAGKEFNARMYGSTLWPSPEGKWRGQSVLDAGKYSVVVSNDAELVLKSMDDTLMGFSYIKKFKVSKADTSIVIQYTMTNISKDIQEVAPWEVTRVQTGGLAFFPKRSSQDIPIATKMYPIMPLRDSIGVIWYPNDTSKLSAQKFLMDGDGWMAYVRNGIVFIKKFAIVESGSAAPNEKNVEAYVSKPRSYIELENQGAYEKLNSGKSLVYEVKWYARRLPSGIQIEIGNQTLINYVRSIVKRSKY